MSPSDSSAAGVGFCCVLFWERSSAAQEEGGLRQAGATSEGGRCPATRAAHLGLPAPVTASLSRDKQATGTAPTREMLHQAKTAPAPPCSKTKPRNTRWLGVHRLSRRSCALGAAVVPPRSWPRSRGRRGALGGGGRTLVGRLAGCCADESTDSLCLFCLVTALDFNV